MTPNDRLERIAEGVYAYNGIVLDTTKSICDCIDDLKNEISDGREYMLNFSRKEIGDDIEDWPGEKETYSVVYDLDINRHKLRVGKVRNFRGKNTAPTDVDYGMKDVVRMVHHQMGKIAHQLWQINKNGLIYVPGEYDPASDQRFPTIQISEINEAKLNSLMDEELLDKGIKFIAYVANNKSDYASVKEN